jgi:hypothetical protein
MSSLITEFPHKVTTRTFFNEPGTGLLCVSNTCENSDGSKYTFAEYVQYPTQVWFETPMASDSTHVDTQPKASDSTHVNAQPMASAQASAEEQPVVSAQELLEQQDHAFAKALAEEQDKVFAQKSAQPTTGSWATVAKAKAPATVQVKAPAKAQAKAPVKANAQSKNDWKETVGLYQTSLADAINKAFEEGHFSRSDSVCNIFRAIPPEIRPYTGRYGENGPDAVEFWGKRDIDPPICAVMTALPVGYTLTIAPGKILVHREEFKPTI